ncbi:MAG: hypothetical protein IPG56_15320 [Caulobacteraceae bacterium]|nr:hypothetical protein [Caulobacteraceae bacterium]
MRYTDPQRTDVEAVLNLPFHDTLGVRIGGFVTDQNEGFVVNATTGNFMDAQRTSGGRLTAEARPVEGALFSLAWEYLDSETPGFDLGRNPALDPSPYVHANQNREEVVNIIENALTLRADFELDWADLSLRAARRERDGGRGRWRRRPLFGQLSHRCRRRSGCGVSRLRSRSIRNLRA